MAQRTQIVLIDDLDGKEIATGGQTVTFGYKGHEYSIDLSDKNVEKLDSALEPYINAARKSGRKRTASDGGASGRRAAQRSNLSSIREWARENGYTVSERGRVSKEIQAAYSAAH